jgi:arabinose-5-phosphate isomerase
MEKTVSGLSDGERDVLENRLIAHGCEVLAIEQDGIARLASGLGAEFARAARTIIETKGRLVVCGVGKSGIVARKIAATFASTGTPAFFLHSSEAVHGDLGTVEGGDVVLAVSKSGEGQELLAMIPVFRDIGVPLIAITGSVASTLAERADLVLDASVEKEACPMDLVPTASTTVALALGDALAMVVMREKDIDANRFAVFHPGGALGRRLLLRVRDAMHTGAELPVVRDGALMHEAIVEIVNKRLGMTTIVDDTGRLVGIISDGDLKRILMDRSDVLEVPVEEVMIRTPKTIAEDVLLAEALERMETATPSPITSLIILNDDGSPKGVIHIHDCLKAVR